MQKIIAIIDFGGQYSHLIARRIRQLGIYSEIYHPEDFQPLNIKELSGIILSGGPESVLEDDSSSINFNINDLKVPLLGICYGHQLIAYNVGGNIKSGNNKEYGLTQIKCNNKSNLFKGLDKEQEVWMSHGDYIEKLPDEYLVSASSDSIYISAFESTKRKVFGVQFHPEVIHTKNGLKILDNFISLCVSERLWKTENYVNVIIDRIRKKSEGKKLFLLLSGGVDSLVSMLLCIRAVGNHKVFPLHIDTGFMRENESSEVMNYCDNLGFKNLKIVNYQKLFLQKLKNIIDPEEKRKIIGRLFVDVLHKELSKLNLTEDWILVQGTIYPDTIESGSTKKAEKIKTHHNRVPEIEKMIKAGKVIEPLKEFYKDEVRALGKNLGLPKHLIQRHPFPGPGLAIRILTSNTEEADDNYNIEENKLNDFLKKYSLKANILPIKSVGVQGDYRTYQHPVVIWYDNNISKEAKQGKLKADWKILKICANKLVNKFKTINRVVFSHEELNKRLSLCKCYLEKPNIDLLQKVDSYIMKKVSNIKEIWQMPVVSLPLKDENDKQVFVIRPVCSQDAMTADVYEMDFKLLLEIIDNVKKIDNAGLLFYDITTKPPATIEWE